MQELVADDDEQITIANGNVNGQNGHDIYFCANEFVNGNDMKEQTNPIIKDIEEQIKLQVAPSVLDNTAEIVILHGYIMLFVVCNLFYV